MVKAKTITSSDVGSVYIEEILKLYLNERSTKGSKVSLLHSKRFKC